METRSSPRLKGFDYQGSHTDRFPLWHLSYYDHVLRQEEDLHAVATYIWGNQVRRGLVGSAEEYPFSGPREPGPDRSEDLSLRVPLTAER